MKLQDIVAKTQSNIDNIINGGISSYFTFEHEITGEKWTIRVSNHCANNSRVDENTISFVVKTTENESESGMNISKKSFKSFANQFMLDENGEFDEQFSSIKRMHRVYNFLKA